LESTQLWKEVNALRRLIDKLIVSIEREILRLNELLPPGEKRGGGYLCITKMKGDIPEDAPFLIIQVGAPTREKVLKYLEFSQEKALRLSAHPDHISSWQSRDYESNRYGGAIRAEGYILSFSGLTELADEAVLVNTAFRLGLISGGRCFEIAKVSGNNLIRI